MQGNLTRAYKLVIIGRTREAGEINKSLVTLDKSLIHWLSTPGIYRIGQQQEAAFGLFYGTKGCLFGCKTAGWGAFGFRRGVFVCSVAGKPQKEVFGLGGSRHRGVGLAARQPGTTGGGMSGWDSGFRVCLV
ncbi:hypothetical protein Tco_0442380 [Tanacetum coccineum]